MAKKDEGRVRIPRSELKNYPRSQQRYFLDMGYVVDDHKKPEAK